MHSYLDDENTPPRGVILVYADEPSRNGPGGAINKASVAGTFVSKVLSNYATWDMPQIQWWHGKGEYLDTVKQGLEHADEREGSKKHYSICLVDAYMKGLCNPTLFSAISDMRDVDTGRIRKRFKDARFVIVMHDTAKAGKSFSPAIWDELRVESQTGHLYDLRKRRVRWDAVSQSWIPVA